MSWYEFVLYLHIASAIVWLGAGFLTVVFQERAYRSGDASQILKGFEDEGWLAPRLFIPAALSTLILGILLVVLGDWGFTTAWILIGLAGFATTFLTGLTFLKPTGQRIAETLSRDGTITPPARAALRKRLLVGRIDMAILFTVVFDMAVKPRDGEVLLLLVPAGVFVLLAVLATSDVGEASGSSASTEI